MSVLKALVLIRVEPGTERDVLEKIIEIPEVVEAGIILGEYDIYALIEIEEEASQRELLSRLSRIVINRVRRIKGVQLTLTLITFDHLTQKWRPVSIELLRPETPMSD